MEPMPVTEEVWSLQVLEAKQSTRLRRMVRICAELLFQRAECRGVAGKPSMSNPESVQQNQTLDAVQQNQTLDAQLMDALDELESQRLQTVASLALQVLVDRSEI